MITTAPMGAFPTSFRQYNNITPFTYRDGLTYLEVLESLRGWLVNTLVPHIDTEVGELTDAWHVEMDVVINTMADQLAEHRILLDDAVAAVVNSAIEITAPIMAAVFADPTSALRIAIDADIDDKVLTVSDQLVLAQAEIIVIDEDIADLDLAATAAKDAALARALTTTTIEYKTTGLGVGYTVTKVHTHGKFIPGIVRKEFANDYHTQNTSGVNFTPVRENLKSAQARYGASVISSADGWDSTGPGVVRGAQIRQGVVYHDLVDSPLGSDSLAFFADGSSKVYSVHSFGHTMADMAADGVLDSFSYGPAPVRDGVRINLVLDAYWGSAWNGSQISARQILGQSATGDIILITVDGKTDVSGLGGNDMGDLALLEGCHNAIILDGGGSAQTMVSGIYTTQSSDTDRVRPVPSFLILNSPVASTFDTGWQTLALEAGYLANGEAPAIRQEGREISYKGQVKPETGSFGVTAAVTVAIVPQRFWQSNPSNGSKTFTGAGPGELRRKVLSRTTGELDVAGGVVESSYVSLDSVRYSIG